LLGRGAPVSPRAARAITPLHEAVRLGHPEVARLLLRAGADRDAKDEDGLRPIDHAGGLRAQFEAVFAAKD
jgi:ankyrin repeat protein